MKTPKTIKYRGAQYRLVEAEEEKEYFVYPLMLSSAIVRVKASSLEEARQKAWDGEGEEVVEFRSTQVPVEEWYVMESPGQRPSGAMGYEGLHNLLGEKIHVKSDK